MRLREIEPGRWRRHHLPRAVDPNWQPSPTSGCQRRRRKARERASDVERMMWLQALDYGWHMLRGR